MRLVSLLVGLLVFLAACGSESTPTSTSLNTQEPTISVAVAAVQTRTSVALFATKTISAAFTAVALDAAKDTVTVATELPTSAKTPNSSLPSDQVLAIANDNLIVRAGPGTAYKQIGGLKKGDLVVIKGVSTDRGWALHAKGWSSLTYLTVSGDLKKIKTVVIAAPPTKRPPTAARVIPVPPTNTPFIVKVPPTVVSSGVRTGAICRDGTRSSATGRGACSHHGGVAYWLY